MTAADTVFTQTKAATRSGGNSAPDGAAPLPPSGRATRTALPSGNGFYERTHDARFEAYIPMQNLPNRVEHVGNFTTVEHCEKAVAQILVSRPQDGPPGQLRWMDEESARIAATSPV